MINKTVYCKKTYIWQSFYFGAFGEQGKKRQNKKPPLKIKAEEMAVIYSQYTPKYDIGNTTSISQVDYA